MYTVLLLVLVLVLSCDSSAVVMHASVRYLCAVSITPGAILAGKYIYLAKRLVCIYEPEPCIVLKMEDGHYYERSFNLTTEECMRNIRSLPGASRELAVAQAYKRRRAKLQREEYIMDSGVGNSSASPTMPPQIPVDPERIPTALDGTTTPPPPPPSSPSHDEIRSVNESTTLQTKAKETKDAPHTILYGKLGDDVRLRELHNVTAVLINNGTVFVNKTAELKEYAGGEGTNHTMVKAPSKFRVIEVDR